MAYQQSYYGYPGEQSYQEGEQQLEMSMGETKLMYYHDQYRQQVQYQQQGSEQQHRYSVTSCKLKPTVKQLPRDATEVIPEEVSITPGPGGMQLNAQRYAESALLSWKAGKIGSGSLTSGLSLSTRSSDVDLKDFLTQRGNHPLEGLHKAAAQGDRARIMHIMRVQGPDAPLNELDGNGCTPLMYAAAADSVLAIEILLSYSAKREQVDSEGRTAVHYAAFFGKHQALKFLIEAASDWTPRDVYGRTPLHWSCVPRSPKCLSVLLRHAELVMGDINVHDVEGMTPLHCAAHLGRARHIATLNSAVDCDCTVIDNEGKTALHWTVTNKDPSCILALVEAYPPLLNRRDMNSNTILHLVAASGAAHLVDALLRIEGIEIDGKDASDQTSLHLASMENHPDVIKILLRAQAVDSYIDRQGLTALHYAVENNSLASLRAFAELSDLTHIPDNIGRTPLMVAAQNGFNQAVEILIKNPSVAQSIDYADGEGKSALHLAAQSGSSGCVRALLSSGADPNLVDNLQQTPLFPAVEGGHSKCIEALISKGSQPDMRDLDGHAPLHKAVLCNQEDSLLALLTCGADVSNTDASGYTALHIASYAGNEKLLILLLERSADPNLQDPTGATATHLAAMEGRVECLKVLLDYGANANIMDFSEESNTAVDYAMLNNHEECVQVLSERGGVSISAIKVEAAICIQSVYRGYRARVLRAKLMKENRAATTIAAYVRGLLQRRKFAKLKQRHHAATVIQAHARGYMARVRFHVKLANYREQASQQELMEKQYQKILQDRADSILKTFYISDLSEEEQKQEDDEEMVKQRQREQKLRLEAAMKMRDRYCEKQRRWHEFRAAERQRRIDKANQEELNYFAGVIADSQARRQYSTLKFKYTTTVRSHHQAAVIIQRAFHEMKARKSWQRKVAEREEKARRKREDRAARVIQKAWRLYKQYQLYQALNFKSVLTSPVITMGRRQLSGTATAQTGVRSYERDISITGNPRHKMHQTELSGFKVFRPTTLDLLFKPRPSNYSKMATVSPRNTRQPQSRPTSILSSTLPLSRLKPSNKEHARKLTFDKTVKSLTPTAAALSTKQMQGSKSSERTEQVLPELIQPSPVKEGSSANSHLKLQPKLHLPAIVSS